MAAEPTVVRLRGRLDDKDAAAALNARLAAGTCTLDWREVEAVSDPFVDALLAGLALDAVVEALGSDSMPPTVQAAVLAGFDRAGALGKPRPKRKAARRARTRGPAPAVWQAEAGQDEAPGDARRDAAGADDAGVSAPDAPGDGSEARNAAGTAGDDDAEATDEDGEAGPGPARPRFLVPPSQVELRSLLEQAVIQDLLGPAGGPEEELTDRTVRDRYLVGMLAPKRLRQGPEQMDRLEVESSGGEEDRSDDGAPITPTMFPSAIGLSFCVAADAAPLRVIARWGRYRRGPSEVLETETGRPQTVWRRVPMEIEVVIDALSEGQLGPYPLITPRDAPAQADQGPAEAPAAPVTHAEIRGLVNRVDASLVVSLFLVNVQDEPESLRDQAWIFQPELVVEAVDGRAVFCARRGPALPEVGAEAAAPAARTGRAHGQGRGRAAAAAVAPEVTGEEQAMSMLYRDRVEFAVGHGVAVHAEVSDADPRAAVRVRTRVVPVHDVPRQEPPTAADEPALASLVLDMKILAETPRAQLGAALRALPDAYQAWIGRQRRRIHEPSARLDEHTDQARAALDRCDGALARIRDGLALLAASDEAAEAFRFANRAMWLQRIHTLWAEQRRRGQDVRLSDVDRPENRTWRAFQLAFILLNLDSVTRLHHPHRSDPEQAVADLLWFPTGGGKTEAYLGLAAYTMGLRRLQGEVAGRSGEHGVAVLMRYTLRLLTLQQFQRAAALICACESIRREAEAAGTPVWGRAPFRIGLWVGARSTPNKTKHAAEALKRTRDVRTRQASPIGGVGTPVQLKSCPWCGAAIEPGRHVRVEPFESSTGRTLTFCGDRLGQCEFSERQAPGEGLPVVVVDEEVYRRLPTLLIATVDKFAQMPWNGAVQMLFGQVTGYCSRHGFAAPDLPDTDHPRRGALPAAKLQPHGPLRPPDLIIQDELHLISGPLGTLTGLYETAVDELCSWDVGGTRVRPKVVASTATIRRAGHQIRALFVRDVQVFPPQGLDAGDSFFARERAGDADATYGRRYLGICAPGRRLKAAIIRVYVAFLAAAQQLYDDYGVHVDPWMTLVGYFSSLRELAGTRRLVDDDIASRVRRMDRRGLAARMLRSISELTSRMGSTEIPELLDRLELPFDGRADGTAGSAAVRRPLDVLLATNMVSVGVDVRRLGLMVVAGQPKNTAEYIQATSRVGRAHPGLVCTIYNWARPRDLSHYESFEHYHATFYRHVEALSVTPFAPRALDRGLSALLVALVRLTGNRYAPNHEAAAIRRDDAAVQAVLAAIARRAALVEGRREVGESVRQALDERLEAWVREAAPRPGGARLGYRKRRDGVTRALLENAGAGRWNTFTCLSSLRDVEPAVDLVLDDSNLDVAEPAFREGEP